MGLLSGLGGMGLGDLEGMSLYEDPKAPVHTDNQEAEVEAPKISESDFLFEKSFSCPICNHTFKSIAVRAGKSKLTGTDIDLRAKYDNVEPLKYDVVMCPYCGCTSLARYWGNPTSTQAKNIREKISVNFKPKAYKGNKYTYDEALERYQMALANAIVKGAKASEKAYICLKAGWLLRSKQESLDKASETYEQDMSAARTAEDEYLKNALEGFIAARANEMMPICGMDESTLDYLIAALSIRFKEYERASKLVGNLLVSRNANSRIKEKAYDLKELIKQEKN